MAAAAKTKATPASDPRAKKLTQAPKKPRQAVSPASAPSKPEAIQAASAESPKPKQKPVRDGFTMPRHDFALIGTLKERMVAFRRPTRKSELLRAGLHALMALPDARLAAALDGLAPLRPGRPKKSG
jgi:hypothetical protein